VEALQAALARFNTRHDFDTDQGSQFRSPIYRLVALAKEVAQMKTAPPNRSDRAAVFREWA